MCLNVKEEEPAQVYPEEAQIPHPSHISSKQSVNKRVQYMQSLQKEKKKLRKRFSRPAPIPDPGIVALCSPAPVLS
ncbi:coiled-coil domain-containing protein 179 [Meriones unguiculatus]|uniref:coiled-coil domain-containing protein 179 n=1 Tax=Meriones unguiculatus TaxID=10047 RepID=UPI000B4FBEF4|nr:coiled-coil domain-containing protein 179 [Meriones unguiculatus]